MRQINTGFFVFISLFDKIIKQHNYHRYIYIYIKFSDLGMGDI